MVGVADFRLASCYKDFAQSYAEKHAAEKSKILYTGDWGWGYYMDKVGFTPVLSKGVQQIVRGATIVVPTLAWPQPLPKKVIENSIVEEVMPVHDNFPVRSFNGWAKAFFYAEYLPNGTGFLPYSFSLAPLEIFSILKVK